MSQCSVRWVGGDTGGETARIATENQIVADEMHCSKHIPSIVVNKQENLTFDQWTQCLFVFTFEIQPIVYYKFVVIQNQKRIKLTLRSRNVGICIFKLNPPSTL